MLKCSLHVLKKKMAHDESWIKKKDHLGIIVIKEVSKRLLKQNIICFFERAKLLCGIIKIHNQ